MTTVAIPDTTATGLLTPAFVRLLAVDLGAMTGFYLLLAVVPMHASAHGADGLGAGLTTAVLMFASVAGELVTPRIAARFGYRRLLVVGLVLLGAPAFALAWVTDLGTMLLVGVVRGLGFAIVVTATGALAASTLPVERRGEGLGLLGVVSMVPAVTALPAGVWLAEGLGSSAAFALGAVVVLAVVPVTLGLPRDAVGDGSDHAHGSIGSLVRRPGAVAPAVVFTVAAVAGGAVVTFLPEAVTGHAGLAAPALFVQALTATRSPLLRGPLVRPPRPARAARPRHGAGRHGDGAGRADRDPGRRTARDGGVRRRLRPRADGVAEPDARGRDARAVRRGVGRLERRLRPRLGPWRRRGRPAGHLGRDPRRVRRHRGRRLRDAPARRGGRPGSTEGR